MKKILFALLLLAALPAMAQTTVSGKIQDFGKKVIISYYDHYDYHSDTIRLDKNDSFQKHYAFASPTYIRVATIEPTWFSAFLIVMPNKRLDISKNNSGLKISGSLENFNNFIEQLNQDTRSKFQGVKFEDNDITQYKLDRLNDFFATSADNNTSLVKTLSKLDAIVDHKLYSLLVKWNADSSRMHTIARVFKNRQVVKEENDFTKYLDQIDFESKDLAYIGIPSLSMMNNFIRILRMHEVLKDTLLKEQDEYLIERRIIKTLFTETPFRAKLLGFNLSSRISSYTKYPTGLSGIEDYISDYEKEKFTAEVAPTIHQAYGKEKAKLGSLAKGANAPTFKLPDDKGKQVALADFNGKVVYLDLWASWCGPCIAEMPHLQKLREKYAGKDVAFVAISIDTDTRKWLKKIKDLKLDGIQLIDQFGSQNSKIATDYKVHGVPHYVLIDKKGKIASAFAPIPSSAAEIEREINSLLK